MLLYIQDSGLVAFVKHSSKGVTFVTYCAGGPVFNEVGECVGIAFQSLAGSDAENIGYVIPTPVIQHFLTDFRYISPFSLLHHTFQVTRCTAKTASFVCGVCRKACTGKHTHCHARSGLRDVEVSRTCDVWCRCNAHLESCVVYCRCSAEKFTRTVQMQCCMSALDHRFQASSIPELLL